MLYHLLRHYSSFFSDTLHFYAYQHVLFRSVIAILTSLAIALLIGPRIIRWLMRMKIGDR
ncbi:MAG: phospho-N-acetylmuramoyl-pentapeptide-transferase, partial [Planctomycetes bacterium]|nr:phospho-N-acetylmuramoyl-pentapeptide-transferase [Planctomycetota bacterium]